MKFNIHLQRKLYNSRMPRLRIKTIKGLHRKYIKMTPKDSYVKNATLYIGNLKLSITRKLGISSKNIFIRTRSLKHMYDKRTAQVYDLLLDKLLDILRNPECIYKNKSSKRGSKCFVKKIGKYKYLIVLEEKDISGNYIVTGFPVDNKYLKNFRRVWYWKDGNPHRNT